MVRDLLGREQVIVAPYYTSSRLLRPGLREFSYEAGFLRRNFGIASADYGRPAALATERRGITDRLTAEMRAEWSTAHRAAGGGAAWSLPGLGTAQAAVAASQGSRGAGRLLDLGFDRQAARTGVGFHGQWASTHFLQVGQDEQAPAIRQNLRAYASTTLGTGSVWLNAALQTPRDRPAMRLVAVGYGRQLDGLGYLGLSLSYQSGPRGGWTAGLVFTRALDGRGAASAGLTAVGGELQRQLTVQRNLPAGDGSGWRLQAFDGRSRRIGAAADLQRSFGLLSLAAEDADGRSAARIGASGGLVRLGGGWHASRRIDSSFALVEVPGLEGIGVYADNQLVARTDADGRALLTRLRPYQNNPVRIEKADLPMDARFDRLEADAVPGLRSGTVLRFAVSRPRSVVLHAALPDGRPVPAGAVAAVVGRPASYPVGSDGLVYLTDLEDRQQVELRWTPDSGPQRCTVDVDIRGATGALPDLGSRVCATVPGKPLP